MSTNDQFTEIFVIGDQYALFGRSNGQDFSVFQCGWIIVCNGLYFVLKGTQKSS